MTAYLLRRCTNALALVAISMSLGFVVLHIVPGDPFGMVAERSGRSADAVAHLRSRYGLDQPITTQYVQFMRRSALGDFGTSLVNQQPVPAAIRAALGNSLLLGATGLLLAMLLGMAIGSLQGWKPRARVGRLLGAALTISYAAPEFILAIALITLLSYKWAVFPIGGIGDPVLSIVGTRAERLRDQLWHLVLPALTLAIGWGAAVARQQRVSLLNVSRENHVRSARAKGVSARDVFLRHGVRPSLPSVCIIVGLMVPELIGGAVVIETLFAWPGVGSLLLTSIAARDYPMMSAAIVVVGVGVALAGLCTDMAIAALDPRARAQVN